MCGIVWARSLKENKPVNDRIWQMYKDQSERGKQGFGFVLFDDKGIKVERAEFEDGIRKKLFTTKSSEILFHHRYPTSTPNIEEATHPITVTHKSFKHDYYVVHNGVITNEDMLKEKHDTLGFKYTTLITEKYTTMLKEWEEIYFNDSESLAIELALYLEGKQKESGAIGSAAVIILQVNKRTQKPVALFYGRNGGNTLKMHRSKKAITISSESAKGVLLNVNHLYRMDYKTGIISTEQFKISQFDYNTNYCGYGYNDYGVVDKWDKSGKLIEDKQPKMLSDTTMSDDFFDDIEDACFNDDNYVILIEKLWELEGELSKTRTSGNYDKQQELEGELADIIEEKAEYERYYKRLWEHDNAARR